MIFILLANGPSLAPLFFKWIPQIILVALTFKHFYFTRKYISITPIIIIAMLLILANASIFIDFLIYLKYMKLTLNIIVALVIAQIFINKYGDNFPLVYSNVVLAMTVTGIIGLFANFIFDWGIVENIGERSYYTNFLTCWIKDLDYNSSQTIISPFNIRLQSFFDEPGTFGIILIPALYYFIFKNKIYSGLTIFTGILLTESINAILIAVIILIYRINSRSKPLWLIINNTLLLVLIVYIYPYLTKFISVKSGVDEAFSNKSSLSDRTGEYYYFLNNIWDYFIPFSNINNLVNYFPSGISSSYINWYLSGGIIFIIIFFCILTKIFFNFFLIYNKKNINLNFSFIMSFMIFISGFQRTSFLDNILFITLLLWSFMYIRKTKLFIYDSSNR